MNETVASVNGQRECTLPPRRENGRGGSHRREQGVTMASVTITKQVSITLVSMVTIVSMTVVSYGRARASLAGCLPSSVAGVPAAAVAATHAAPAAAPSRPVSRRGSGEGLGAAARAGRYPAAAAPTSAAAAAAAARAPPPPRRGLGEMRPPRPVPPRMRSAVAAAPW